MRLRPLVSTVSWSKEVVGGESGKSTACLRTLDPLRY